MMILICVANKYGVTPTAEASQGLGNPFTSKKAAFAVVGARDFAKLTKSKINYDIRPIPKASADKSGGWNYLNFKFNFNNKRRCNTKFLFVLQCLFFT